MVFIKAHAGPSNVKEKEKDPDIFTVQYFDEKGNMIIRSGGTVAWRCNNPAALLSSPYSTGKDRRSIGVAGNKKYEYAVYPDYETGHEALIVMLRGSQYFHRTLRAASIRYIKEDPDHIYKIVKISKLDPERTINSLNNKEFETYWKAIEQNEGWLRGREDFIERWYITGVHMEKGVICEYQILQNGRKTWCTKSEAILMAESGRLHAVVVYTNTGKAYLRPEYHGKPFSSMIA